MFNPMLAPNKQPDFSRIKYPLLASCKMDGIRCIFKDGQMLSRSLKPIRNCHLQTIYEPLKKLSLVHDVVLDGELYSHALTFQNIVSCVMSKSGDVPESLKFCCFDCVLKKDTKMSFTQRCLVIVGIKMYCGDIMECVRQITIDTEEELYALYDEALSGDYEGLILRYPDECYKYGRATLNQRLMYKMKPIEKFEGCICDVIQATVVDAGAEKKINELGHSVTSKKIGDRVPVDMAAAFVTEYNGFTVKVTIAATVAQKQALWLDKERMIGRKIVYKGMLVGAKDVPRHPVLVSIQE